MEIRETGQIYDVDNGGYLICNQNKSNIQDKWYKPLNSIIDKFNEFFKEKIHSIYVRGSVATGQAIDGISDIDFIILFNNEWNHSMEYYFKQFNLSLNESIKSDYPFVSKVDFGYDQGTYYKDLLNKDINMSYLDTLFLIKHHSICVYGDNIQGEIPKFKLNLIPKTYYDLDQVINKVKRNLFEPNIESDKIKMVLQWMSKRIVRCGYELVSDKSNRYTRDLYQCWKLFSEFYPEKSDDMKISLEKAIYPTENKNDMFDILNSIGDWLGKEIKKKVNVNDAFNVQTLRKVQNELYKTR